MAAPNQPGGPIDPDLGVARVKAMLADLVRHVVTIGYQGETGAAIHPATKGTTRKPRPPEDWKPVATIALWMEYGTDPETSNNGGMPARPAIGTTFERHSAEFNKACKKLLSDIIDGRADLDTAVTELGDKALEKLRATIDDAKAWAEPLAESTVQKKGHDVPWLDTGTLREQCSWALRLDGKIKKQGGEL